jgi:hypothetical protein
MATPVTEAKTHFIGNYDDSKVVVKAAKPGDTIKVYPTLLFRDVKRRVKKPNILILLAD